MQLHKIEGTKSRNNKENRNLLSNNLNFSILRLSSLTRHQIEMEYFASQLHVARDCAIHNQKNVAHECCGFVYNPSNFFYQTFEIFERPNMKRRQGQPTITSFFKKPKADNLDDAENVDSE